LYDLYDNVITYL